MATKKVKVKFIKSPTGLLKLAYNVGAEASLEPKQAKLAIEAGLAEKVTASSEK